MSDLKRTQLYDVHVAAGAAMVDFGGWEMPIEYPTKIVAEHLYTRAVSSTYPTWAVSWWRGRRWSPSSSTCSPAT